MKRKQALVVGIDDYTSYIPQGLVGCVDYDAAKMKEALETAGYEVIYLTNEDATFKALERAFAYLAAKSDATSDTLIYQSSHGASRGKQQALCLHDRLLMDWEWLEWCGKIEGNRLAILDACNSEGMFYKSDGSTPGEILVKGLPSFIAEKLTWRKGKVRLSQRGFSILAAADKDGYSYATPTGSLMTNLIFESNQTRLYKVVKYIQTHLPSIQKSHYANITRNFNYLKKWF